MYISVVTNVVANAMSRLEYDKDMSTRYINVYVRHKALAKALCHCHKATTEHKAFQTDVEYLPTATITMIHGPHKEHKYNSVLVADHPVTQQLVCCTISVRQQAIVSKQYLFANRSAEKEDEVYPVTVK